MINIILDCGHGGVASGIAITPGKRSPDLEHGFIEGEYVRQLAAVLTVMCSHVDQINLINLIGSSPINIPLKDRVKTINLLDKKLPGKTVMISLHTNASSNSGWGDAEGCVGFHHPSSVVGRDMVEKFLGAYPALADMKTRGRKTSRWFTMLRKTSCPAALLELGFHDNMSDVEKLKNIRKITDALMAFFLVLAEG